MLHLQQDIYSLFWRLVCQQVGIKVDLTAKQIIDILILYVIHIFRALHGLVPADLCKLLQVLWQQSAPCSTNFLC